MLDAVIIVIGVLAGGATGGFVAERFGAGMRREIAFIATGAMLGTTLFGLGLLMVPLH